MVSKIKTDVIEANSLETSLGGPVDLIGQKAAQAWGHIVGTNGTPYIGSSLNISSYVDIASGRNSVSFTNAFTDTNRAGTHGYTYTQNCGVYRSTDGGNLDTPLLSYVAMRGNSNALVDPENLSVGYLGDLA